MNQRTAKQIRRAMAGSSAFRHIPNYRRAKKIWNKQTAEQRAKDREAMNGN